MDDDVAQKERNNINCYASTFRYIYIYIYRLEYPILGYYLTCQANSIDN